jgi:hypothetical protein
VIELPKNQEVAELLNVHWDWEKDI